MRSDSVAIECDSVAYRYPNGVRASDGIDLKIERGEFFALIGPNGAGKTTLVRLISTLLRPTSGRVAVQGIDPCRDPAAVKRRLGVMPQQAGLFESLTVEEHLQGFGPLRNLTRSQTASAVARLVERCDLEEIRARKARTLSGGESRRLLVALAMLADPEILVLDEPSVGLDPIARRRLWGSLKEEQRAGKTILMMSHYMDEVEKLADRIGFIANGRIEQVGTLGELRDRLGKSYRVTERDAASDRVIGHADFDSLEDAQRHAVANRLEAYSIGRVGVEDLFLRLAHCGSDTPEGPGA